MKKETGNYGKNAIKDLLNFSVINIDKPSGPTSFQVSNYVCKSFKLSKTSHMGTLDPLVSGVLPLTLGRACRLSSYLMHKDKEYVGIMRVHSEIPIKELEEKIKSFIGKIMQLPPVRSSVKREEREREIKSFKILEIKGKDFLFKTEVQAGTYIRKLIHDLGEQIGGAHMLELRRTKAGLFKEESAITLYEFDSLVAELKKGNEEPLRKIVIPAEKVIKEILPSYEISSNNLKKIFTGKPLMKSDFILKIPKEELFSVFIKERFIGIYKKVEEGSIIGRAEFVFN
ncbi:MAG: RNA-guided pseudouridylation complex pseudouridine synthase subunit Cbf5 [Nanoarchaeota archaeon]